MDWEIFMRMHIELAFNQERSYTNWTRAVCQYAMEMLESFEENNGFDVEKLNEKSLLRGARDWQQYSNCGFSLVGNSEIAERLCSPTQLYIYERGMKAPVGMKTLQGTAHSDSSWIDVQAVALKQAAEMVLEVRGIVTVECVKNENAHFQL